MKVTVSCLLSSALFRTSALRRLTIRSWRWWRCSAACRWPCPESSTCSTTASHRWRTAHIPAYLNMSSWQHSKRKTWQTVEHKHSMSSNTTHWCTFGGACVTRSHKNLAVWQQRTEEVKQGKALYAWQALKKKKKERSRLTAAVFCSAASQCRQVKITILGEEGVPVQVDGEAWIQPPGIVKIVHKNRAQMLTRDRVKSHTNLIFVAVYLVGCL